MPGPDTPARDDRLLLEAAALSAGQIALGFWQKGPANWEKPDGAGPVSEADLAVDAALKQALTAARPGYGWLSEESPDDAARLAHDRVFIIDPIDGTRAFLAGEPAFALSLAVAQAGRITAAVVHLPAKGLTYAADAGGHAQKNGQPIHCGSRAALTGADVLTSRASLRPEDWPRGVPELRRSFRPSLAWRLCLAAEGRHDAMLTLNRTWEWDSAAGSLIAERAGCAVTDRHGQALRFNAARPQSDGVIAAPPALHAAILGALHA